MERDFEFGGRKFKLSKIDAFKQLHIVRRVAPLLGEVLPALKGGLKEIENLSEAEKLEVIGKFMGPIITGMSKLSDEDTDIVLYGLLESVEVQQPGGSWARVASGKMLMIQDIELPMMLQVAAKAFMFNIARFFSALPQ